MSESLCPSLKEHANFNTCIYFGQAPKIKNHQNVQKILGYTYNAKFIASLISSLYPSSKTSLTRNVFSGGYNEHFSGYKFHFCFKLVHFIASGHFISGCGGKGSGAQSLRFSGLLAAFTPIASYRRMKAFRFAIG